MFNSSSDVISTPQKVYFDFRGIYTPYTPVATPLGGTGVYLRCRPTFSKVFKNIIAFLPHNAL